MFDLVSITTTEPAQCRSWSLVPDTELVDKYDSRHCQPVLLCAVSCLELRLACEECQASHPHCAHSSIEHYCRVTPHTGEGYRHVEVCACVCHSGCWLYIIMFSIYTHDIGCCAPFGSACSSLSSSVLLLHEPQSVLISLFSLQIFKMFAFSEETIMKNILPKQVGTKNSYFYSRPENIN